ncbi:MAG TPA: copper chaperone PCu(A)C [Sphingomonas sp.]|jgi:hypothetical protein
MRNLGLALAAVATLAACDTKPDELFVDKAWVRLAAVPGRPAAAYFTLHGAPDRAATLIAVSTDIAISTELHESMAGGMRPIRQVVVPPKATIAFEPGGRHAMLFDVNAGIKPGGNVTLTFAFSDGTRLEQKAIVRGANE